MKTAGSDQESGAIARPRPSAGCGPRCRPPRAPRGSSPAMTPSDARTWPMDLGCSPERLVSVPMRGGEGCFAREDDKVLIIQPLWLIPWCHRAFSSTGKKHLRFHLYQPHMPCGLGRLEPGGAPRQQVSLRTGVCLWLHGNLNPPAASCEAGYLGVGEGHLSLVLVFPLFWGGRLHRGPQGSPAHTRPITFKFIKDG